MENFGDLKTDVDYFEFNCNCGAAPLHSKKFTLFHILNLCEVADNEGSCRLSRLSGLDLSPMQRLCDKSPPFKSLAHDFGTFTMEIKRNEFFNCNCGEKMLCSRGLLCSHFNVCKSIKNVHRQDFMHLLHEAESKELKLSIVSDIHLKKAQEFVPSTANLQKPKQWKKVARKYGEFSSTRAATEKGSVLKYKFKCSSCNLSINDSKSLVINHLVKGCQEKSNPDKNFVLNELHQLNEPKIQVADIETKTQAQESSYTTNALIADKKKGPELFQTYLRLKIEKAKLINKRLDKNLEILNAIRNLKPKDFEAKSRSINTVNTM